MIRSRPYRVLHVIDSLDLGGAHGRAHGDAAGTAAVSSVQNLVLARKR